MNRPEWRIYLGKIPHAERGDFWVSFESDQALRKTKSDIYARCLPCIQNLYRQLKLGNAEITLGNAYNCWKITAIVEGIEECLSLLGEFEKRFPVGHVHGKFGSGQPDSETRVVVFHTENVQERDRIRQALEESLAEIDANGKVQISRACAVLYNFILGDWRHWQPTTPIKYPANAGILLERIKNILYRSVI
ncbi:MAG: hypothetical protein SV775_09655 [Thermodesulfobacteriota bacterium]|nr:hypothetical protein [Thermodesulfobacteriota bacterium]